MAIARKRDRKCDWSTVWYRILYMGSDRKRSVEQRRFGRVELYGSSLLVLSLARTTLVAKDWNGDWRKSVDKEMVIK